MNESLFSSKTDQWETPADLFKKLNDEFHFTLDPCADESNHKCEKYFTKEQNGLIQDWSQDVVFCNPPYGRNIGEWVKKAFESVSSHTHTQLSCFFRQGQTQNGFTITFTTKRKSVSFVEG